jgi:hypothetical protein
VSGQQTEAAERALEEARARLSPELAALHRWMQIDENRCAAARMGTHVGYLTAQHSHLTVEGKPFTRISLNLRDSRRSPRTQYRYLTPHNFERLEIKVGSRYKPAREVLSRVTCASCGSLCAWADDAWVCEACGDEWYPGPLGHGYPEVGEVL